LLRSFSRTFEIFTRLVELHIDAPSSDRGKGVNDATEFSREMGADVEAKSWV